MRSLHETTQRLQLDLLAADLSHELREAASALKILAAHHELDAWVESNDAAHLSGLTQEFVAFAEIMKEYDQIRLLDASGMEQVRVNHNDGKSLVVPPEALQNKGGRYYFDQIMALEKGAIYLSSFDLNEEEGEREHPLKPVIRFGISLSDRSGRKRGAVILNYSGTDLIHHFNRYSLKGNDFRLRLDSKNLWLQYFPQYSPQNSNDKATWQFIYDEKKDIGKEPLDAVQAALEARIGKALAGQFYTSAGLISFRNFYPERELGKETLRSSGTGASAMVVEKEKIMAKRLTWQFSSIVKKEMLYTNSSRVLTRLLVIYAFFSVAFGGGAYALARIKLRNEALQETLSESENRHAAWVKSVPVLKKKGITKILVVEDEAITALDLSRTLIRLGYETIGPVDTGEEAIAKAGTSFPDLVLMDIHLKGKIDGIEAAGKIHDRFKIPVIFLSAHTDQETIERAKMTLASGFLVKPFREQELSITIKMIRYRHEFEMNLADSEERFRTIFNQSTDAILLIEPTTRRIVAFNKKAHKNLGYTRADFAGLKMADIEVGDSENRENRPLESINCGEETFQTRHRTRGGGLRDITVTTRRILIKKKPFLLFICHDFTERNKAAEKERLSNSVFANITEGMTITDADCKILSVNAAFTKITGYRSEEVIGRKPAILQSGRHNQAFYQIMWDEIYTAGHWEGEIWNRRKNGEIYPQWLSITAVKDGNGKVVQYSGLFSDITQRKADEEKLLFQAHYDPLTELPNRILLRERLSQAIKQSHRSKRKAALLFLDLDHFKQVNDTFGHLAGDAILKQVAKRLLVCVRETDTVARSGGDEFLILLPEIDTRQEAVIVAKKIIKTLSDAFQYNGQDAFLGGSIGITIAPDDGETEIEMIKSADMSLYKAKSQGRNTYRLFNKKMLKTAQARTLLEWNLRQALENEELRLYYQPIIDLDSLETVSLEALIRWEHPQQGLLFPDKFIPLAEESNLICDIGDWVLETACIQMKQWQERYGIDTTVSVNVSTRQIKYGEVWQSLTRALDKSHLSAKSLTLEITESLMIEPVEEMIEKLKILKQVGVQLSIDDFGTGYSSLSYLSRFPVDKLKIDKSFIQNLEDNPEKKPLVETIVNLGKNMKLKVIAEGIEKHKDLSYLRWLHCDMGQGYYFSKPIPAETYEKVLEKQRT